MSAGSKDPDKIISNALDSTSVDPLGDGIEGLDFSPEDFLPKDSAQATRKGAMSRMFGGFLLVFRLPEIAISKLYRSSFIRNLLYRFDWYRDLADQQELGSIIEDTYGGPEGGLSRLRIFIRQNLLFTCLACAAIYFGGRYAIPEVLQNQHVRSLLGQEVFDVEKSVADLTEARKQAKEILNRRVNIEQELEACLFTPEIRTEIMNSIGENGLLAEGPGANALGVARRYHERLNEMNFDGVITEARDRMALLSSELGSAINHSLSSAQLLETREIEKRQQNSVLTQELSILVREDASSVGVTNAIIRAKDELAASTTMIEEGPTLDSIKLLQTRLAEFTTVLRGKLPADYETVKMIEPYPNWYISLIYGDQDDARDAARKFAERGLIRETGSFEAESRPLISDSVHRLTILVEQAITAVTLVENRPAAVFSGLLKDQVKANEQIGRAFGKENSLWINHEPCLKENGVAIDLSSYAQ